MSVKILSSFKKNKMATIANCLKINKLNKYALKKLKILQLPSSDLHTIYCLRVIMALFS